MSLAAAPSQTYAFAKEPVFESIGYVPHEGQEPIHWSGARNKVASCGRRFGKSVIGGYELAVEALYTHTMIPYLEDKDLRREFWIVGPEYTDAAKEFRIAYNTLKRLQVPMDHPGTYYNEESGDLALSLFGGKYLLHGKSAKYPGTLVGEGLNGVVLAEAAKLKESVWTKYLRPTLADYRGWSLMTSTPEGKNWFYRAWQRGQDPNSVSWASWRRPSWHNPVVFPKGASKRGLRIIREALKEGRLTPSMIEASHVDEEIVDMMMDMSEEKFNQEIGADFTEYVGRVFKDFDEEVHVRDLAYDPRYPAYGACDYGWTNPFVWLVIQVDVWDNIKVLAEYRVVQKDITEIARDLVAFPIIREKTHEFFPDPAAPGDSAVLANVLKAKSRGNTGGELKWRLELIRKALRLGPRGGDRAHQEPQLLIDRSCVELIREMSDYRYPDSKEESLKSAPEQPMDKDDHGPEALGRFFRGYYGGPEGSSTGGRAKVSKANMGGSR